MLALLTLLPRPEFSPLSVFLLQNGEVDGPERVRRDIWSTATFRPKAVEYYYYVIATLLFIHYH